MEAGTTWGGFPEVDLGNLVMAIRCQYRNETEGLVKDP